jgi:hypothetical protein
MTMNQSPGDFATGALIAEKTVLPLLFAILPVTVPSMCVAGLETITRLLIQHPVNNRFFQLEPTDWQLWLYPLLLPLPSSVAAAAATSSTAKPSLKPVDPVKLFEELSRKKHVCCAPTYL